MDTNQIIVYSATWCAFCHQAKQYFDSKNIKYTDLDIEKQPEAGLDAVKKSGQRGIPVIDIAGDIIVGFDRQRIDAALEAHKITA